MTIKEKIFKYFAASNDLRVLFVFDALGMLRYEIDEDSTPWPEDYVYQVFAGDWFTTKIKLAHEWADKKVVLVFNQIEPTTQEACLAFPLMSALQANMVFHEEDAIAFMQQRDIPMQYADFFKRHITELLRERFNKVLSPYYHSQVFNLDCAHRGILSVYLGSHKMLEWYQIIAQLVILGAQEDTSKANAFWHKLQTDDKARANDIQATLTEKLKSLVGDAFNPKSLQPMTEVVEAMKYNAITQLLAVQEADPYKRLKIQDSVRLQQLNSILTSIAENTKLHETFAKAFEQLGQHIQEEKLLEVYGPDAPYAFLSEEMCKQMVKRWVNHTIYTNPEEVQQRIVGMQEKAMLSDRFKNTLAFLQQIGSFYACINSMDTLKLNTPDQYLKQYTKAWYQLDKHYRQAVCAFADLGDAYSDTTESLKMKMDHDYAVWANELNLEWVRCMQEVGRGFETITMVEKQPDFFKHHIGTPKVKTAVIVSDAFRYEMAAELMERLTEKKHVATLTPALAMLPTETKYCKLALLPHEELVCTGTDMLVDGKQLGSTEARTKHLQQYCDNAVCINYDALMGLEKREKREVFKHKLVYVFHNTLDEQCHGCNLKTFALTTRYTLDELLQLILFIHDYANVTEVYVTADHGFLYNDIPFEEKDKQVVSEDTLEKKTRYFLCHNEAQTFGISKFHLQAVSAMKGDYWVGVATGTNRLAKEGGDYTFAHGGASLQELVIPIFHSKYKEDNQKGKVSVSLLESTLTLASSRMKAHLVQGEAVTMKLQPLTVHCAIYVGDEAVSPVKTLTLNATDPEMGSSRIYEVDLTVTQSATSKIMQFKVFKEEDTLNPVITKNIVNNTLIEQDDF